MLLVDLKLLYDQDHENKVVRASFITLLRFIDALLGDGSLVYCDDQKLVPSYKAEFKQLLASLALETRDLGLLKLILDVLVNTTFSNLKMEELVVQSKCSLTN